MSLLNYIKKQARKKSLGESFKSLSDLKNIKKKLQLPSQRELRLEYLYQINIEYTEIISIETQIRKSLFHQYSLISDVDCTHTMDSSNFSRYLDTLIFNTDDWKKSNDELKKGIIAETAVRIVLTVLHDQNYINNFLMTRNYSLLDTQGIDTEIIYVTEKRYQHMPLQIKSSIMGQQKHMQRYDDTIPSLIVNEPIDFIDISKKIKHIIHFYKDYGEIEHV